MPNMMARQPLLSSTEKNIYGETGLHNSVLLGHLDVAKKIMEQAEDSGVLTQILSLKNKFGDTLLHSAAKNGSLEMVQEIARRGGKDAMNTFTRQTAIQELAKR